jgi:hypothetical protein
VTDNAQRKARHAPHHRSRRGAAQALFSTGTDEFAGRRSGRAEPA